MKKNGFTLVELLAVLVVLSIIVVITIPIITKVLEKSKRGAATDSAYGYKEAVNKYYYKQAGRNINFDMNGVYAINDDGTITQEENRYDISFTGKAPSGGYLIITDGNVEEACIQIDKYKVTIIDGVAVSTEKASCSSPTIADGLYNSEESGRRIFKGTNPNNWIWLDENDDEQKSDSELYRILSYESDGTIKVVRNESIGEKEFDSTSRQNTNNGYYCALEFGCNVWGDSDNTLFNNTSLGNEFHYKYFETAQSKNPKDITDPTGIVEDESTLNKYLNDEWLSTTSLGEYIAEHSFNVGGIYYDDVDDVDYVIENKKFKKEKQEEHLYTWTGKVGILSITEYAETSANLLCSGVYSNYIYNPNYYYKSAGATQKTIHNPEGNIYPCNVNNWNYKNYDQWSLSVLFAPNDLSPNSQSVWAMYSTGQMYGKYASASAETRPTFYLKSTITLTGEGTQTNPYQISNA